MNDSLILKEKLLYIKSLIDDCEKRFSVNVDEMNSCCSFISNSTINTKYMQNYSLIKQKIDDMLKKLDLIIK